MAKQAVDQPQLPTHGAAILPSVTVDSYNLEIEDEDGFVGDKATKSAFSDLLDKWRQPLKEVGQDPLGSKPSGGNRRSAINNGSIPTPRRTPTHTLLLSARAKGCASPFLKKELRAAV